MTARPRSRVAAVSYLNARPLFEPLEDDPQGGAESGLPAEVARRVAEDEVEVALMPVAAAATIGDLRIARGMAIGSRGPVRSVVIVVGVPRRRLHRPRARPVVPIERGCRAAPASRAPSRARAAPRRASPEQGVVARGGRARALVIGDPALVVEGRFPHVFDLAEAWRGTTGLPFVFAAWCGRPGSLRKRRSAILAAGKDGDRAPRRVRRCTRRAIRGSPRRRCARTSTTPSATSFGEEERAASSGCSTRRRRAPLAARVRFFDEDRAATSPGAR